MGCVRYIKAEIAQEREIDSSTPPHVGVGARPKRKVQLSARGSNMNPHVKISTRINPDELKPYLEDGWQLIPLRGKRPRDRNWPEQPYESAKVLKVCVANNWNVGVRLSQRQLV